MADKSRIEWTDATWNPVTGCDKVSPGCAHCYAFDLAARLKAAGSRRYQKDGLPPTSGPGFGVTLHEDVIAMPDRWTRPRRVFVNSMSDLFHEQVPFDFIERVFGVMATNERHTFQVLTKRPARMCGFVGQLGYKLTPNIWLGTSVESQYWADRRIPELLNTPADVRFLSCEPLLAPISFRWAQWVPWQNGSHLDGLRGISWVIVGGESGPKHRAMEGVWVRDLRDECIGAGVPFFFKQWGGRTPKAGGRELDGRTWNEYPEVA